MKKILLIFLLIISFTSFSKEIINIGLDDTFAPMGFRSEKGEIVGFDIDLSREVCKRLDLEPNYIPCDWDGILFQLKTGRIDLIWNGLTVTENRKKEILFSDNYLDDGQVILVRENSNVKNLKDLENKKIGVQMGSTSYFALEKSSIYGNLNEVRKYSSNVEAILDLEAGRTNGVIIDEVVGRYYQKKEKNLKILNIKFPKAAFAVGMRKNDKNLQIKINKALNEIKKDGTFDSIKKKWFGEENNYGK
ncbi:polar amino acid transport system substrate-binding protein [Cetobacterium ceti]|uniref:Polar amino acid transport system substrate-binding protein n=1 Tax=Cetobacterium ceti TaxID=180163 RepID=A0A1T4N983_9FUSO|nr:amino acid ABC transporter substrate-binding protein [Cetobacterium ceti]SJZ75705.1 polar amino acid transport system substrate-binding protein [Cetobacterium ceti]